MACSSFPIMISESVFFINLNLDVIFYNLQFLPILHVSLLTGHVIFGRQYKKIANSEQARCVSYIYRVCSNADSVSY